MIDKTEIGRAMQKSAGLAEGGATVEQVLAECISQLSLVKGVDWDRKFQDLYYRIDNQRGDISDLARQVENLASQVCGIANIVIDLDGMLQDVMDQKEQDGNGTTLPGQGASEVVGDQYGQGKETICE